MAAMSGSEERQATGGGAGETPGRERPELATRVLRAILMYPTALFSGIGDLTLLTLRMLGWMVRPPYRLRLLLQSMAFVGVGSLFIITLTALTSGMVLALQGVYSMRVFNAEAAVGGAVAMSLTREISPVFTALMITARASSAIATELGTMRVTDQIDALATMGVSPIQYLVVPRVLAGAMMTPVLCLLFTFIGMVGCYLVAVVGMGVDPGQFMDKVGRWVVWGLYALLMAVAPLLWTSRMRRRRKSPTACRTMSTPSTAA